MMNRIIAILTVLAAFGCARHPQAPAAVSAPKATESSGDAVSEFLAAEADVQVFGYGPAERGDGPVGYFMLYVKESKDAGSRLPSNTRIAENQMGWVIQILAANDCFGAPEKPTPEGANWRIGVYGPPGRVERYCTKQEFDKIVKAISDVLPNGLKVRGR